MFFSRSFSLLIAKKNLFEFIKKSHPTRKARMNPVPVCILRHFDSGFCGLHYAPLSPLPACQFQQTGCAIMQGTMRAATGSPEP